MEGHRGFLRGVHPLQVSEPHRRHDGRTGPVRGAAVFHGQRILFLWKGNGYGKKKKQAYPSPADYGSDSLLFLGAAGAEDRRKPDDDGGGGKAVFCESPFAVPAMEYGALCASAVVFGSAVVLLSVLWNPGEREEGRKLLSFDYSLSGGKPDSGRLLQDRRSASACTVVQKLLADGTALGSQAGCSGESGWLRTGHAFA